MTLYFSISAALSTFHYTAVFTCKGFGLYKSSQVKIEGSPVVSGPRVNGIYECRISKTEIKDLINHKADGSEEHANLADARMKTVFPCGIADLDM